MACIFKFNGKEFKTLEELAEYVSTESLDLSDMIKKAEAPVSTEDLTEKEKMFPIGSIHKGVESGNILKVVGYTKDGVRFEIQREGEIKPIQNLLFSELKRLVNENKLILNSTESAKTTTTPSKPGYTYVINELPVPAPEGELFSIVLETGETKLFVTRNAAEKYVKTKEEEAGLKKAETDPLLIAAELARLSRGGSGINYRKAFLSAFESEKEDIAVFKAWLSKVLPQVSLEITDSLIDGVAMGSFLNGVIKIYQEAGSGTGFHEAFEAVWNSYLKPEQKQTLIYEYKNRKNYKNLPEYIWAKQTYPGYSENALIKEALAEEFISYVRDGGKTTIRQDSVYRNTLFRKFLNLISKLWKYIEEFLGLKQREQTTDTIDKIFKNIVEGVYANAEPVGVMNRPEYRSTIPNTSVEYTHDLMEGMSSYFFSLLYETIDDRNDKSGKEKSGLNINIKSLFDKSKPKLFNDVYEKVKEALNLDFGHHYNLTQNKLTSEGGLSEIEAYERISSIPEFQYKRETLKEIDGVVKMMFKKYLSQFGINFVEVKEKQDSDTLDQVLNAENENTDRLGILDAIYVDPKKMAKNEVKLLIASLSAYEYSETNGNYEFERSKIGLPKLKNYSEKINLLLNEFSGLTSLTRYNPATKSLEEYSTIDQMFDKLDVKYKTEDGTYRKGYEWISSLKRRLGYTDENGEKRDVSQMNYDEITLMVAFETSFTNNRNIPYKLIINPDSNLYVDNTLDSTNAKRVKDIWVSNAKSRLTDYNYTTDSDLINAPMIYLGKDGIISINKLSKEFLNITPNLNTNIEQVVEYLKLFGIEFSIPTDLLLNTQEIEKAYRKIHEFIANGQIKTIDDLYSKQVINSTINFLTKYEAELSGDMTMLTVRNAEGKQQYSITQPSLLSHIVNSFNSARNLADFIASNPQLGVVDLETGNVILHPYAQNSNTLKLGGRFFDSKGKRKTEKLEYRYILGVSEQMESIGVSTDRLTYSDKITQEAFHILDGTYFTIINSDKSSEFGLSLGEFLPYSELSVEDITNEEVIALYKDALRDEIAIAIYERKNKKSLDSIKEYTTTKEGQGVEYLGHFRDIINLEKNTKIKSEYEKVLNGSIDMETFLNEPEIETLISNYIKNQVKSAQQWLIEEGLVKKIPGGGYESQSFSKEQLSRLNSQLKPEMTEGDYKKFVAYLVINRQISAFEQHKLFLGHPELFKDLAKRSSAINSQKQVIADNQDYLNWLDVNMKRYDGLSQRTNTLRYTSYNDPEMHSIYTMSYAETMYNSMTQPYRDSETGELKLTEAIKNRIEKVIGVTFDVNGKAIKVIAQKGSLIKAYTEMVENDGGSYCMPDFFRDLHFLSGKPKSEQEALLDYNNALEILDRSNPKHPMYSVPGFAKSYTDEQIKKAEEIVAKGKPEGVVIQVLKPHGFGYNKTNAKRMHSSLLKNSIVTLTWSRVVNNKNMLEKYIDAQSKHIDVIAFGGSQKVGFVTKQNDVTTGGTIVAQNIYNPDGTMNRTQNPIQEMFTKYFGFQVEMASYAKNHVIFGSQMRKIVLTNLPEHLKPIAERYNKLLEALTIREEKLLLKQLGIRKENDDFIIEDVQKTLDLIKNELERRDLPENMIDLLVLNDANNGLKYNLDASGAREKLNNVLNALVDKRILAQEMYGKAAVQIPATMYEIGNRKITYLKDDVWQPAIDGSLYNTLSEEEKKTVKIVSSDLKFYNKIEKNGKTKITSMEVYVPWLFGTEVNPADNGFKLENGIWIPENAEAMESLLKSIGFRIPTQGMNSIDSIVIKGFLSDDYGDSVVVPTEMVGKAGSDFDIDKLNMFFKNFKVTNGVIKEIKYDSSQDNLQKRYHEYLFKEFADSLKPLKKVVSYYNKVNKTKTKELQKLNNDILFAEEMITKGDVNAGKLIMALFKQTIQNIDDLFAADEEYNFKKNDLEYYDELLTDAINKYEEALEIAKSKFTFEEFSNLPIEQQNSKEAVQNELIDILSSILTDPSNFAQLITPNSTSTAKPLAEEIRKLKNLPDEETNKTSLSEFEAMSKIREAYQTGKKLVGITALQITSHTLCQYGNITLTGYYKKNGQTKPVIIRLNIADKQNGKTILNLIRDNNYQIISELLSESMNGAVDAAKDPFIFDLNLTLDTASTWFYLQKLGLPFKELAYLHNQPIIVSYFKTKNRNKSTANRSNKFNPREKINKILTALPYIYKVAPNVLKEDNELEIKSLEQYQYMLTLSSDKQFEKKITGKVKRLIKRVNRYMESLPIPELNQNSLKSMIKPVYDDKGVLLNTVTQLSKEELKTQIALLQHYLELNAQASSFSNFVQGISWDTTKTKNISENVLQKAKYDKIAEEGFIELESLERLMNMTFLNKIKDVKSNVQKMFKEFFVTLSPAAAPFMKTVIDAVTDPNSFMLEEEKVLLLNRYENFLLTYITHVIKYNKDGKDVSNNNFYKEMFLNNSIAKKLKKYQKAYPDNLALKMLMPVINSNVKLTDNVKTLDNKFATFDVDAFGESMISLYNYAVRINDNELKKFVQDINIFSILQSGSQMSPISYTRMLPIELYSEIVNELFERFQITSPTFTPELVWKQFHQNNYMNGRLVETVFKTSQSYNPSEISLISIYDKFNQAITDDYVVVKYIKKELLTNKEKKEDLIKQKKFDEVYDSILYERVKTGEKEVDDFIGEDDVVYKPINTLGNGMYLTEVYSEDGVSSVLENNGKINESVYDSIVEKYINDKKQEYLEYIMEEKKNAELTEDDADIIYSQLGDETQSENVMLPEDLGMTYEGNNFWDKIVPEARATWQNSSSPLLIAFRGNKMKTFLQNYKNNNAIGNPFNWQDEKGTREEQGIKSTKKFIRWMITGNNMGVSEATEEYRQAIIDDIKSGKWNKSAILYYEEKGYATHATALDYLINQYDWNKDDSLDNYLSKERQQEIITNFAAKHKLSPEEALNYINTNIKTNGIDAVLQVLNKKDENGINCY